MEKLIKVLTHSHIHTPLGWPLGRMALSASLLCSPYISEHQLNAFISMCPSRPTHLAQNCHHMRGEREP